MPRLPKKPIERPPFVKPIYEVAFYIDKAAYHAREPIMYKRDLVSQQKAAKIAGLVLTGTTGLLQWEVAECRSTDGTWVEVLSRGV